ncbi:MAG TPA: zf-HC2 domain-containing protein [Gemmatimonadales bacterium]|nr:zf-HC2 domain-containing protein [Gemmatimonadales bacterium]
MPHVDDGTLHAYLDGELSPPEAQAVEAHVAQCPACRTRLDEERALIARAEELLAQAAPPDRELPPFRPPDVKPPARLWWQVRTPLAWAATIALALGIGTYVGERERGGPQLAPTGRERPTIMADQLARPAPAPGPATASAPDSAFAEQRQRLAERRLRVSKQAASPAVVGAMEEKSAADSIARGEATPVTADGYLAAKAPAPSPAHRELMQLSTYGGAVKGPPIGVDSARLLLGSDPLAVPDLPVRGIYRARMIGYTGMVIVEQALDSSTVIEVINGRRSPLALDAVVVTGAAAALPDSQSPGARALLNTRAADSLAAAPRPAPTPPADQDKAKRAASGLFVDVLGPLPPDSLAALKRLLRPLPP